MIYDITLPLQPGLPTWPGDPPLVVERVASVEAGDGYSLTRIALSAHAGTHVDAPAHYLPNAPTAEALDLDVLIGPAQVFHVPDTAGVIDQAVLETLDLAEGVQRVLFRTRNSEWWAMGPQPFREDFVALSAGAARWLVARGVRLVGVDYLSVAPMDDLETPHQVLLSAGVIPVEGLDLRGVPPGHYGLICLPLKLVGSDGAPARVVLTSA